MALTRLAVTNLRNLAQVDIQPTAAVNLIYGENGSGKTSLLESVNLLSMGRSFRSHKIKPLITQSAPELTVFGRLKLNDVELPLGVSRSRNGDSQFRVQGRAVESLAELASYLPLQVINADAFSLLEGPPKVRRQFLDWLVFHVEHEFYAVWKQAQRSLKQRNTILRRGRIEGCELTPWSRELIAATERIQAMRQSSFDKLLTVFEPLVAEFVAVEGLNLGLYQGWERDKSYADLLEQTLDRDLKQGFTGSGFHRAEIRIKIAGQNAADVLSRGQQKLLVCALKLAQGQLFEKITGRKCVYLVDDLPAELDERHRHLLVKWLNILNTQVFITGVDVDPLIQPWRHLNRDIKVFHVEHGAITSKDYSG
ncbi:DNA replication/repair protein RecF [Gilvimarinus sp. DA14]|uniref:DNA replication/repair protein RecF n=1 Tax=Gilvimarinus sp. DA14 TaxID=2956798 RepID=UPI0020B729F7|nr:DNA replication/repair protein RecF [Gilvimarinus sp. DA14]UTF59067.1 DNA replication/repair protein RecF [Gilvimarinus sp. DA14]